ncbi:hypothetical protein NAEGRDRAFT_79626 [Naegleria gruberi]|uniref:TRAF3-interacting protein 1 N-terminal domain-containing protein n=1 Tax=Naegleria gruberi TaxID=5762 RepID=D2VE85_NAEGR|nr:uncharacterized protein NAEGRDRAFT_79626 [Naegleria gruberi]EFC44837.1 hypothetical protein NAEGRDRAFT_79626 [Naegleria gruberi]|eukprot:XP_002677581.1 hypothetical protein NAEGRDRAFT_79626 [Naegleria gruberi strain NEG-M]
MSDENYDEETKKALSKTKQELEALISKPPIQEKHLAKPPTKFIAAVVFHLKKETGYPEGLFDDEFLKKEMNTDEKTLFLKQLINVVVHTIRKNVNVKVDLLIKGKENPKNTCLFFKALATAAGNKDKYKYKEAIERIKSGKYKDVTEREDSAPEGAGARPTTQQTTGQARPTTQQTQQTQQSQQPSPTSPTTVNPQNESTSKPQQPVQTKPPTPSKDDRSTTPTSIDMQQPKPANNSRPSSGREVSKPSTPSNQEEQMQGQMDDPNLAQYSRPFSSRGQSARRAPPKIKTNVRTIDTQEMPTEKAQIEPKGAEGLITDDTEEKEEEQIIIEKNAVRSSVQVTTEQKGSLMSKLMENENDIEKKRSQGKTVPQKSSDEPVKGIVLQTGKKEKDKEQTTTELSSLREQIQTIVSKVNPLGKTMDYIQEDLDSMQREHDMWRKEVEVQRQRLIEERLKTDQEVSSVQAQLRELEQNILDKLEKINSLKSTVIQNDKLLENLLRNVVS